MKCEVLIKDIIPIPDLGYKKMERVCGGEMEEITDIMDIDFSQPDPMKAMTKKTLYQCKQCKDVKLI